MLTPEPLLTPAAAAVHLGIEVDELVAAVRKGGITFYRVGRERMRFERVELEAEWPPAGWHWPPAARVGSVYWIGPRDDALPVKVGWAVDPERRRAILQAAAWVPLVVMGAVPGTVLEERRLHRRLAAHRLRGEWFEREPALALLAELRARGAVAS